MTMLKATGLGFLGMLAFAPSIWAQAPVAPVAAPTAAPANLWSFLCPTAEQSAKCHDKFCKSPIGQLVGGAAKPVSGLTGGLIGGDCGVPTAADLAKMNPESAEGTAAAIKKSEAEAKARRAAIRYLGTVDCNYWPEAKAALKSGLRADPNECVRYEAALALGRGCCCNKEIIDALHHSANGDDKDGNPRESSDRVRAAAHEALQLCTAEYVEAVIPGKKNGVIKEGPRDPKEGPRDPKEGPKTTYQGRQGVFGVFAAAAPTRDLRQTQKPTVDVTRDVTPASAFVTSAPLPPSAGQPPVRKGLLQMIGGRQNNNPAPATNPTGAPANGPLLLTTGREPAAPPGSPLMLPPVPQANMPTQIGFPRP